MKLTMSGASPYVRKARAVAIHHGLALEMWEVATSDAALQAKNPLAKIPTLITDDGMALYDSPVCCEYLDSLGTGPKLYPAAGPARWKALQLHALADGIMDASQPRRREIGLPQDEGRVSWIALQKGKVDRAIAALEAEAGNLKGLSTIGEITIGCALGYLDFRFAHEPWRPAAPKLAAWYEAAVKLPPLAQTMPAA